MGKDVRNGHRLYRHQIEFRHGIIYCNNCSGLGPPCAKDLLKLEDLVCEMARAHHHCWVTLRASGWLFERIHRLEMIYSINVEYSSTQM